MSDYVVVLSEAELERGLQETSPDSDVQAKLANAIPVDEAVTRMARVVWDSFINHDSYDHAGASEKAAYQERMRMALAALNREGPRA